MAEEKRKVQLEAEVVADTSGLDAVAEKFEQIAQVGQQGGQQAARGLDAIGNAAAPAAQKLDAAVSRMAAQMQRAAAAAQAGAKGTADFYESLARSRGIDLAPLQSYISELRAVEAAQKATQQAAATAARADAFVASLKAQAEAAGRTRSELLALQAAELGLGDKVAPYIQRLREVEQGHNKVGMSAAATANAMRTIPAQLQDIAVSLQGGMNPLTVLSQQGSQLATVFGGVGPAIRGVATYVLGLVNPFTVGAAAVALLAVAAHQGSQELRDFQNAATLSGNAIGVSASNFTQLRDSLAGIAGSKGKAADALTEIAKNGQIAGDRVREVAEAAILMERATGQSVGKTVAAFAELARSPAEASRKLNDEVHHLTAAVYAQIKALEDQGDKQRAADLAERTYADAMAARSRGVVENVSLMERAWRGLAEAAKGAWDRMTDPGRGKSLADRFGELSSQVARGQGPFDPSAFGGNAEARALLEANRSAMQSIFRQMEIEQRNTSAAQENAAATKSAIAAYDQASKTADQYADRQTKLNKALKEYRDSLAELRKTPPDQITDAIRRQLDPAVIARTEAGLRASFRETTGGASDMSGAAARQRIVAEENRRRQQALSSLDFSQPLNLTESEKKVIEIEERLKTSLDAVTRSRELKALATAKDTVEADRNRAAQDKQIEGAKRALETITRQAEAAGQQADSIEQQARAQEAANATFGKSATAIQEMVLAQLRLQAAEADSSDTFDPRYVAGLQKKVEAQQRYVDALKQSEAQQIRARLTEEGRAGQEDVQTLQLQISLLGRSRDERERIIAQRKVEVDLARELATIDRSGASDTDKEALRIQARANAAQKAETEAARASLQVWERVNDQVGDGLYDALTDRGKSAADRLEQMFSQLVLRPLLQPAANMITNTIMGNVGQAGAALGSANGSAGGVLGSLGGLGSLFGAGGLSGSLAAGAGWLTGATTFTGALGAAGSLIGTGTAGGILSGIGMGLGALGPIGLGALAAYAIFGGKGGGPKTESGFGTGVPLRGDPASAKAVADAIAAQYSAIAGEFAKDLKVGVFTATDPQGDAMTQLAVNARLAGQDIYSRAGRLGGIENVGRSQEELAAAITEETNRVILKALAATGLPDKIGAYLRQLGDVDRLSGGALQEGVTRLQAAMTQRQTLDAQLFALTHTQLEQVVEARRKERLALDETNRALYDHVAALTDLRQAETTARDNLLAAYQSESDALRGVVERHRGYAQQLREVRDSLSLATDSPLSASQRAALAGSRFRTTLAGAIGGEESALQGLGGAATDFLTAARATAQTPVQVAAAFAKVQAGLTTAAAASEGRASVAQLQLDAMTQQLTALGLLNTSVLHVGEALGAFLNVQTQIQQEQLRYTAQMAADQAASEQAMQAAAAAVQTVSAPVSSANTSWEAFLQNARNNYNIETGGAFVGGAATGGWRMGVTRVGERGEEIVDFDTPGRVYTSEQTRGMFASNAELLPVMRQIAQLLRAMQADSRTVSVASVSSMQNVEKLLRKFDVDGMPPQRVEIATP